MLGMLRTAMPSRDALLRSSRVPSHWRAQGQRQAGGSWCLAPRSLLSLPARQQSRVPRAWRTARGSLEQPCPGVAQAAPGWLGLEVQTNTPWLCFSRADNHRLPCLVLLSPLFQ